MVLRQNMIKSPFLENDYFKKFVESNPDTIRYVELIDNFCDFTTCKRWGNGWLYSDTDHLSALGAEEISEDLKTFFELN